MQSLDEDKRSTIEEAAARLFLLRPFHEVKLDEVAKAARIGKGTVYLYFRSKEDLYLSLVFKAFSQLVDHLRQKLLDSPLPSDEQLRVVIAGLTHFAFQYPHLFQFVRSCELQGDREELEKKRNELSELIEKVLRHGIEQRVFQDQHPELTSQYILSFIRGAFLYGPPTLSEEALCSHIYALLINGLKRREACDG